MSGGGIKDLRRHTEQASVPVKRRCLVLEKRETCSGSWFESKPRLSLYMVLCYSASNETDISNVRFSSSLLTLPSIRSSGRSNHVRWLLVHLLFSRQQPNMRQVATCTIACGSHQTPAGTRTVAGCSLQPATVGVVPLLQITQSHPSHLNHNPQPWPSLLQMPESWGNNMFNYCFAAFSC